MSQGAHWLDAGGTTPPPAAAVPVRGVVTVSPASVHQAIQKSVHEMLQGLPKKQTMVVLSLRTEAGINLAVAHRFNKHFEVVSWIGKSGWDKPLKEDVTGAISFAFSR